LWRDGPGPRSIQTKRINELEILEENGCQSGELLNERELNWERITKGRITGVEKERACLVRRMALEG
jgi:hypothetical protein